MQEQELPIRLATITFDPLAKVPVLPEAERIPETERTHTIVQFTKSLTREERARIQRQYQLKLMDYIPEFAYLELVSGEVLAKLSGDPLFRAAVPYRRDFKIAPGIGERIFRTPERLKIKGLWLSAQLFPDADTRRIVETFKELGATDIKLFDDRQIGGFGVVYFVVPASRFLPKFAALPEVRWIEEVGEIIEDNSNTAGTMQSGTPGTVPVWNKGLHGEGQIIGIIDSKIDIDHCFFRDNIDNTIRPAHRKVVGFRNTSLPPFKEHGTFAAGIVAGDDMDQTGVRLNRGNAWAARLTFGNRDDVLGTASTVMAYLNAAAADGAFIHSNSWHVNTANAAALAKYNETAAAVDAFTWHNEDHLVLGSAGNVGNEQGPPGTAKNAICVGAALADPNEMFFGNGISGPTDDGRRKPDLFAPGGPVTSSWYHTTCGTTEKTTCATSWATPAASAAAALIRQYYTEGFYPTGTRQPHDSFLPTGALLKATLLNSTIDMTGIPGYPGNQEGWGLIRLDNVLFFPGSPLNLRVWDMRNFAGLCTGESREHHIEVATNSQRLKVTLVWTDPPGSSGSGSPVINNLDLEVVSPDGSQTFFGNDFAAGFSTSGGAADALNNVEQVQVNLPAIGDWTILVRGTAVNAGNSGQGYALVVTADLPEPPVSTGAPDTLVVRVQFPDVAFEPPLPNLQNLMIDVANQIFRASNGKITIAPVFRGVLVLDRNKDYYYQRDRNLLIELSEEVMAKLVGAEPMILNGIERMIVVTNDMNLSGDFANTGPWSCKLPAESTRSFSVSIQTCADLKSSLIKDEVLKDVGLFSL